MPPNIFRMAPISVWSPRINVRLLSVFCRSLLLTINSCAAIWIPLADGFDLRTGSQDVTVPANTAPGEYHVTRESVLVTNYHLNFLNHGLFFFSVRWFRRWQQDLHGRAIYRAQTLNEQSILLQNLSTWLDKHTTLLPLFFSGGGQFFFWDNSPILSERLKSTCSTRTMIYFFDFN
jgi:hypothetical protein